VGEGGRTEGGKGGLYFWEGFVESFEAGERGQGKGVNQKEQGHGKVQPRDDFVFRERCASRGKT